jgi:hypothetical protein
VILAIPTLGFTYLWDDYFFLTNAVFYQLHDWAPSAEDPFYRPISRGVYFTLLDLARSAGPALGHALNLAFLIAIVILLGSLVSRLAGRRAGILAALCLAGLGAMPSLVGWISCDQDLLAILFTLIALHLRLSQRNGAALAAVAAGLLSKETTLAVIPAIVLLDWILDRKPYRILRHVGAYALLVAIWGTLHPAVRILVSRGLRSGATGYVGLEHPERWPVHLVRYVATLFNVPAFIPLPTWPTFGALVLLAVLAVAALAIRSANREAPDEGREAIPPGKVYLLGALVCAGPLVLTSFMIHGWAPYYAAFPAVGFAMIAGVFLAGFPLRSQLLAAGLYLALGLWCRGDVRDPREFTESNFRGVSAALRKVEAAFIRIYPSFGPNTQVLLSVQARGAGGIYIHMYSYQVLRLWYRDRTLRAVRPEARTKAEGPELLTVITRDRDVIDINPLTLAARTASGRNPDYQSCETAMRAYAMGLAGSGETSKAAHVMLRLPEINAGLQSAHRRVAAMFLYSEGRDREAEAILDSTMVLPREVTLENLHALLAEQPPQRSYDLEALRAFGVSPTDTVALRALMRWFAEKKYAEVAIRFADRMDRLQPGDLEAATIRKEMNAQLEQRRSKFLDAAGVS